MSGEIGPPSDTAREIIRLLNESKDNYRKTLTDLGMAELMRKREDVELKIAYAMMSDNGVFNLSLGHQLEVIREEIESRMLKVDWSKAVANEKA